MGSALATRIPPATADPWAPTARDADPEKGRSALNHQVIQAALGGLLHDIGKFALRAGVAPGQIWDDEAKADYRHMHALLSADVARDLLGDSWPEALQAIAYHHRLEHSAAGRVARLVAIGDRLSSGEREPSDEAEPQQLLLIFERLLANDARPRGESRYLPLQPLRMAPDVLFAQPAPRGEDTRDAYARLWDAFRRNVQNVKNAGAITDGQTLVSHLLHLLRQYTWCIPSAAWRSVPDVSLYDHSRMTAALAVCLAPLEDDDLAALLKKPEQQTLSVALLVGGDISGIQEFIYTITPRGAAPALRGRSLYLQMLTEAVARYVLDALGLPETNLVYAGGGHFYLLAPVGTEDALAQAQRYVSRVLLQHHGGDLYLALAHHSLAAADFYGGRLSSAWGEISARLRQAKERRFSELGSDLHCLLFEPWRDQGNQERECQVCHREHERATTDADDPWRKCPMCLSFEALGDGLRRARFLQVEQIEPAPLDDDAQAGDASDALAALGMRMGLYRESPSDAAHSALRRWVYALDDQALEALQPGPRCAVGRYLLVNVTPLVYDSTKRLERVAANDELARAARGIERLGVLRMDVDDLGRVFQSGLGQKASLSRIATLSLAISIYFDGYVETLARELNPERGTHSAYSIYSGGDDLFFVGAWDQMLALARRIREDFSRYTGGHPSMHLSGGLALVDPHYPLYRAAEEARQAEEAAKGLAGKNAFTFLGRALPWPTFERAAALAERLDRLVQSGDAPRALLRLLMRAQDAYDAVVRKRARDGADRTATGQPQGYYGPWIPRLEYNLARLAERNRGIAAQSDEIRASLREDNYSSIEWIGLAARWAELLNRTRDKENRT